MKSDKSALKRRITSGNLTDDEVCAQLLSADIETKILFVENCFIPDDYVALALEGAPSELICAFLNHEWLPIAIIESYLDDHDENVRNLARNHPKIQRSSRVLRERNIEDLCPNPSDQDKIDLLLATRGDHPLHHRFVNDVSASVREAVAKVAKSEKILERLAQDGDHGVCVTAVANSNFKHWSYKNLRFSLIKEQYVALLRQPWAGRELIADALWRHNSPEVHIAIAQCRHITPGQLQKLDLGNEHVRLGLAENPSTPISVLNTFLEMQDLELIEKLCFRANVELDAVKIIMADNSWKRLAALAEKLRSKRALQLLVSCEHVHVRRVLAANLYLSKETQQLLASDESAAVRFTLAENPNVEKDVETALSQDRYAKIRAVIARSTKDGKLMQHLLQDTSEEVRLGIACNPSLDRETASILLRSGEFIKVRDARINLRRQSHPRNRPTAT